MADGQTIPDWITDLKPLTKIAPFATSILVLMTDPVRWIRSGGGQPLFDWIVGLFLVKPFAAAQSYFLTGFDSLGGSIEWLADGAVSVTFGAVGPVLEVPAMIQYGIQSVLEELGLAAPIAGTLAGLILFLTAGAVISATIYGALALLQVDGVVEGVDEWF
mgnify:CR=1 FL=1